MKFIGGFITGNITGFATGAFMGLVAAFAGIGYVLSKGEFIPNRPKVDLTKNSPIYPRIVDPRQAYSSYRGGPRSKIYDEVIKDVRTED